MAAFESKYSIELVNKAGRLLADLSGRARNRRITESRNEAEYIEWVIDLNEFENYCRAAHIQPNQVLKAGYTEVRVKRLGTYMVGGQITYKEPHISQSGQEISIRASGFLDLFIKRFTGETDSGVVQEAYTGISRQDMAWALISGSQALTNGDYGITRGDTFGSSNVYDKLYSRTNIKDALQDLTILENDPIDIKFTYDKKFNCYAKIGSTRNDISFDFPGNIIDLAAPEDATSIANEIIGIGSGTGLGQVVDLQRDLPSGTDYYLRQDIFMANGEDNVDGALTEKTKAYLSTYKKPLVVPPIVLDGSKPPYVTDYSIGDRVKVKVAGYGVFENINGYYRIEKRTIDIDDDDNETVTLEVSAV